MQRLRTKTKPHTELGLDRKDLSFIEKALSKDYRVKFAASAFAGVAHHRLHSLLIEVRANMEILTRPRRKEAHISKWQGPRFPRSDTTTIARFNVRASGSQATNSVVEVVLE